jgi:hypothetical protein
MLCPRFAQPEVPAIYSSAIAAAANAMANAIVSTHTVNHMDCPQAFIVDARDRLGQIDEPVGRTCALAPHMLVSGMRAV